MFSVIPCSDFTFWSQIHEYMLSKAPPVPQLSPSSQDPEEHPRNEETEAQVSSQNPEVIPAGEELPDQAEVDRIVEEELPANANPNPVGVEALRETPSSVSNNQMLPNSDTRVQNPRPETRVQKADDRLLTLAAVGLAIAIVVLLLKKFIKSVEHGVIFMDGS